MSDQSATAKVSSPRITMRQLEAFNAVAVGGGITAGAAILNLSQPSVTRLIIDLERNVGFALFIRDRKRLTITPEGSRFHEEVSRSFTGIDRLAKAADDIRTLRAGSLRIATMPALGFGALPRTIANIQSAVTLDKLRIFCDQRSSQHVLESVASQGTDVGLALGGGDVPEVRTFARFRMRCVCVMPQGHLLAEKSVITVRDLRDVPFISLPRYTQVMMQLFKLLSDEGVELDVRIETLISSMACAMVSQGIGISVVDPLSARLYVSQGIVQRPFEPTIDFNFRIIYPSRRGNSRLAVSFMQLLAAEFETESAVLRTG